MPAFSILWTHLRQHQKHSLKAIQKNRYFTGLVLVVCLYVDVNKCKFKLTQLNLDTVLVLVS